MKITIFFRGHETMPLVTTIFQSDFWARFRETLGQRVISLLCSCDAGDFPCQIYLRTDVPGFTYGYIPDAPDIPLEPDKRGKFLEDLSCAILPYVPKEIVCFRYDTVWLSPFTDPSYYGENGQWKGAPRAVFRELRMNSGTEKRNLRKTGRDHLSPDTVLINLQEDDDTLLSRMRQTTRNSIRRAYRKDVEFTIKDRSWLPAWYRLYSQTAERKGLSFEKYDYFDRLITLSETYQGPEDPRFYIYAAEKNEIPLAGAIVCFCGKTAYYLYAGSSTEMRECMPNYGLQWEIIRDARAAGCIRYDLLGVPPNNDPYHSMYGLYTFKTGLGGNLVHYSGCWDYPLNSRHYDLFRNTEALAGI